MKTSKVEKENIRNDNSEKVDLNKNKSGTGQF